MAGIIDIGPGDLPFLVRADLKHWGGRRGVKGPYEMDYERFATQASKRLGEGGVVGVPNARGSDNPLGPEYRFEELLKLAKESSPISQLGDGRVFYDSKRHLWVVKAQEINGKYNGKKLTYLVFNVPIGTNFSEKDNSALENSDTIKVLTLTSCMEQTNLRFSLPHLDYLLGCFDGIVVHSSSAAGWANRDAETFYNYFVTDENFQNSRGQKHLIGAVAVSGGHRTPKESFLQRVFSPVSVGSSYTIFPDFKERGLSEFTNWLRNSIQGSQDTGRLVKGSSRREEIFRHAPRMAQEVLYGRRTGIFQP